jgi:hypothetical protein
VFESCHNDCMAGGMSTPRCDRPTLLERSRQAGVGQVQNRSQERGQPPPFTGPPEARHCWVINPDGWPGRWPGLLLEWQKTFDGWRGRVTFAVVHEGRQLLVETWLDSRKLARE